MRNAEDFRYTVRRGVRAARPTLVVHAHFAGVVTDGFNPHPASAPAPNHVGFVVSKAVGGSVQRNQVKRRLRHLAAGQLPSTPPWIDIVVRALPAAATEPQRLAADLTSAWNAAMSRLERR